MTRERAEAIKVGDMLTPDRMWNQTERQINRLPQVCKVLGVKKANCELGVMVCVKTIGGVGRWLSAGWFE